MNNLVIIQSFTALDDSILNFCFLFRASLSWMIQYMVLSLILVMDFCSPNFCFSSSLQVYVLFVWFSHLSDTYFFCYQLHLFVCGKMLHQHSGTRLSGYCSGKIELMFWYEQIDISCYIDCIRTPSYAAQQITNEVNISNSAVHVGTSHCIKIQVRLSWLPIRSSS